eukprot:TRINITY_DN10861_c0_g5_i1.p1 TRINITY_DN10861_c0_g5~~TRINITY_DN10861_c0_g5_i1.p1  ORF type:complete len:516 (+),score=153.14 TRINITY_DN10861_c0_g5_i1:1573-3120(+)
MTPAPTTDSTGGFHIEYVFMFVLPVSVLACAGVAAVVRRWSYSRSRQQLLLNQRPRSLHVATRERVHLAGTYLLDPGVEVSGLPVWVSEDRRGMDSSVILSVVPQGGRQAEGKWVVARADEISGYPFGSADCKYEYLSSSRGLWSAQAHNMQLPDGVYEWVVSGDQGPPVGEAAEGFYSAPSTCVLRAPPGLRWPRSVERSSGSVAGWDPSVASAGRPAGRLSTAMPHRQPKASGAPTSPVGWHKAFSSLQSAVAHLAVYMPSRVEEPHEPERPQPGGDGGDEEGGSTATLDSTSAAATAVPAAAPAAALVPTWDNCADVWEKEADADSLATSLRTTSTNPTEEDWEPDAIEPYKDDGSRGAASPSRGLLNPLPGMRWCRQAVAGRDAEVASTVFEAPPASPASRWSGPPQSPKSDHWDEAQRDMIRSVQPRSPGQWLPTSPPVGRDRPLSPSPRPDTRRTLGGGMTSDGSLPSSQVQSTRHVSLGPVSAAMIDQPEAAVRYENLWGDVGRTPRR